MAKNLKAESRDIDWRNPRDPDRHIAETLGYVPSMVAAGVKFVGIIDAPMSVPSTPDTLDRQPETRNPKPKIRNPNHQPSMVHVGVKDAPKCNPLTSCRG